MIDPLADGAFSPARGVVAKSATAKRCVDLPPARTSASLPRLVSLATELAKQEPPIDGLGEAQRPTKSRLRWGSR